MKTLILVRHAKTEQLGYMSSKSDFERSLKPRGYNDTKLVAKDMISRKIRPNLLISSKAMRAKQTARLFAEQLDIDKQDIVLEQFLYDGYTTSELLSYLEQFGALHDNIMIVGHNPEIAMTAISLTDSDYLHFPTTGTIAISFNVDSWEDINAREGKIEWFVAPKMFK
ncbi:histidine phosphatase family protein [Carboxylicivirga sp. A043]|uniref:SixA phosphatase family protein n=1 Tax=Carboxylicivirga litoralis TaxID=2816963 RepID=UPI0021CAED84|nr:histidine phosphatase family protein [Carboxylicivirga sp. A043]MCU4156927.1 histidine phosphatase family protein [Carboxylicivirga sp. A043]